METKKMLVAVIAFLAVVGGGVLSVAVYSGAPWPFFSTVDSESMQHEEHESALGIIDTADMVVIRDPGLVDIKCYVDGYNTGYRTFGEYGDVIIYYRGEGQNPVIHRAIIWLENNGDGTWSAPSLADYPSDLWSCVDGGVAVTDHTRLSGTFTMYSVGYAGKTVGIDLSMLTGSPSGYLTMGDNATTNNYFDQAVSISQGRLVSEDRIKAVAGFEIPWAAWLKLYLSKGYGYLEERVSNTLPCIVISATTFILLFAAAFILIDYIGLRREDENP
ncbi:MAG: S26 family signal peptidase [Candidatus Methanomethylophilaceae archaeon]|nr:S26 family signal peptidase [Candidatus Methanomethylophilaceae archaeon]NLF33374.1 S26 family signal peptidase [Thermoplasmatales archaeon]